MGALSWKWRAKHFFKLELDRAGLREVLVKSLGDSYSRQNKRVFSLMSFAKNRARATVDSIEKRALRAPEIGRDLGE